MFVSEYQHHMNKYIHAHFKTVFGLYSGADLGFASGGGGQPIIWPNFPENCTKMNKIGQGEGHPKLY